MPSFTPLGTLNVSFEATSPYTDSRRLRFMRTSSNPMVYRWLVDIKYDYSIEDILGVENPVADRFLCLVANNMPPSLIASLLHEQSILVYLHKLLQKVHNGTSKKKPRISTYVTHVNYAYKYRLYGHTLRQTCPLSQITN
jgi:hypothetical protein